MNRFKKDMGDMQIEETGFLEFEKSDSREKSIRRQFDQIFSDRFFASRPRMLTTKEEVEKNLLGYLFGKISKSDYDRWLFEIKIGLDHFDGIVPDSVDMETGFVSSEEHPLLKTLRIFKEEYEKPRPSEIN